MTGPAPYAAVVAFLAVLGAVLAALFAFLNLGRGLPYVAALEGVVALVYTACLAYYLRSRNLTVASVIGFAATVVLLLMVSRMIGVNALFWIYVLPLLAFFLFGLRRGGLVNVSLVILFAGFLWLYEPYTVWFRYLHLDILLSYLVVVIFSFIYELQKHRNLANLEHLSSVDPLTGAFNRRKLEEALAKEVERADRYRTGLSIITFDVDDYKRINNEYGHACGDAVLRELAQVVTAHIRVNDVFVRMGGDEFLILTPAPGSTDTLRFADKLRSLIAGHRFSAGVAVTISVGIAHRSPGENAQSVLRRADAALYRAKDRGKDRVIEDGSTGLSPMLEGGA